MNLSLNYRFEGCVFFIYDHTVLKKEEDLLEDAILYFYPHSMPLDDQCLLCGQLMGLVQFSMEMFESAPLLYRLKNEKIAVKHVGRYSFALAGTHVEPDSVLIDQLERLYTLFAFYHGSVDQVKVCCNYDQEMFLREMMVLWELYLAFIRNYGNHLPSVCNAIPRVSLKHTQNHCFMKASHILQACQRRPQVIAGCVLYNRFILCSQLPESISTCLLLLKPNQHLHPAMPIETDYQLPYGVRLFSVYVSKDELGSLIEDNENSPYNAVQPTPFSKCCDSKRTSITARRVNYRTSELSHGTASCGAESAQKSTLAEPSEKDPFSQGSSQENSTKLCKGLLEDLLLKGFKCCKCLDELEGEVSEGSVCGSAVEDVEYERKKDRASSVDSEQLLSHTVRDDVSCDQVKDEVVLSYRAKLSVGTCEGESGIEVTGSDWQSSTATPFEQTGEHVTREVYNRHHRQSNEGKSPQQHSAATTSVLKDATATGFVKNEKTASQVIKNNEGTRSLKYDTTSSSVNDEKTTTKVLKDDETTSFLKDNASFVRDGMTSSVPKNSVLKDGTTSNVVKDGKSSSLVKDDCEESRFNALRTDSDVIFSEIDENNALSGERIQKPTKLGDEKQNSELRLSEEDDEMTNKESKNNNNDNGEGIDYGASGSTTSSNDHHTTTDGDTSPYHELPLQTSDHSGTDRGTLGSQSSLHLEFSISVHDTISQSGDNDEPSRTSRDDLASSRTVRDNHEDGVYASEEDSGPQQRMSQDSRGHSVFLEDSLGQHAAGYKNLEEGHGSEWTKGGIQDPPVNEENPITDGDRNEHFHERNERRDENSHLKCCEVDGLLHANLFVQAHSEIVLILLTTCDLHRNEDLVKSLWSASLSQLGDLDMLLRNSKKPTKEAAKASYNYLIFDNYEKSMLENVNEPVYSGDLVFCDTAKLLHSHFENSPQLVDLTLRNLHTGIYGRRTLSKEVYFQEPMSTYVTSQRHQPQDASSFLERNARACLLEDHGIHFV